MRVLAINDISCVGKCSLTVALPIISACGVTCDILPTAILSTHTSQFEGYTFLDYSSEIPSVLAQWKKLGLRYDYICSGYLGNIEQIESVRQIKNAFLAENGKFIVDPVMGDNGALYPRFDDEFVKKMFGLCMEADYILPNPTEACFLTGEPFGKNGEVNANALLSKLTSTRTCPVVTGVVEGENISVYYLKNGRAEKYTLPLVGGSFHGSGDVFAAAFVGALANGKKLSKAVKIAADFTTSSIENTAKVKNHEPRYGLFYEERLGSLIENLKR